MNQFKLGVVTAVTVRDAAGDLTEAVATDMTVATHLIKVTGDLTAEFDVGDAFYVRIGSKLSDVERWLIEATLQRFSGNKRRAADVLGCSVKPLYNRLDRRTQPAGEA